MGCFDNVAHENIDNCPNVEVAGGTATRLLYAPAPHLDKLDLPTDLSTYESRMTIPEANLVVATGKGFKGIDVMVDESELKSLLVGNRGNKKSKSELEFYIPGFNPKVLGFVDAYKNVPMVLVIIDANGNKWVFGTKLNPAFVEGGDGTTGKKYEDNSGVAFKAAANSKLYYYPGAITELPDVDPAV